MQEETIHLSAEHAAFVAARIAEGAGATTVDEVVAEALALLERTSQREKRRLEKFLTAVEEGDEDLHEGRSTLLENEVELAAYMDTLFIEAQELAHHA